MTEDRFFELIDPALKEMGARLEPGEEFRSPPLDLLRYYERTVKLGWMPIAGRALSVVAVVRQPVDLELSAVGYERLQERIARAVNGRFPPWKGLSIGLTSLVTTPEPIRPEDDAILAKALEQSFHRFRVVPFGLIRVNLGQEAVAFALKESPDGLFPEPGKLADVLSEHLRRYVPFFES